MYKIDGTTANYLKTFEVYKEYIRTNSVTESIKKGDDMHEKIHRIGLTKEDIKGLLEEWKAVPDKNKVFPSHKEAIIRIETKLESLLNGTPVAKTYEEWRTSLEEKGFSKKAKKEITDSLVDFLENEKDMAKTFGNMYEQFSHMNPIEKREIVIYLP